MCADKNVGLLMWLFPIIIKGDVQLNWCIFTTVAIVTVIFRPSVSLTLIAFYEGDFTRTMQLWHGAPWHEMTARALNKRVSLCTLPSCTEQAQDADPMLI